MARDFQINGECLVRVKSRSDSNIGSLSELGLAQDPITVSMEFSHRDIKVDAWGAPPPEIQFMLGTVSVSMNLIHLDRDVLDTCIRLSMGGAAAVGQLPRAGARMGGNVARFAVGNNFIGLNLSSPVQNKPWRFYYAYLANPPMSVPLGTEKSVYNLQWRVVPYTTDPWQGGSGASGQVLWDYVSDS